MIQDQTPDTPVAPPAPPRRKRKCLECNATFFTREEDRMCSGCQADAAFAAKKAKQTKTKE